MSWEIDALKDTSEVNFVGIGSCVENMMRREQFKIDEEILADLALISSSSPGVASGCWLVKACVHVFAFKNFSTFQLIKRGLYPNFLTLFFLFD